MSRLHARLQRAELALEHAQLIEAALREAGTRVAGARSVQHDRERARNLPIIGPMGRRRRSSGDAAGRLKAAGCLERPLTGQTI